MFDLFDRLVDRGHVVAEGFTLNRLVGIRARLHAALTARGHRVVVGHLDATVDACVANIAARRTATGRNEAGMLNVDALRSYHASLVVSSDRERAAGIDVRNVPWRTSTETILTWLREAEDAQ